MSKEVKATASAARMAKAANIKLEDVPGTGKDGKVLKEDVESYLAKHSSDVVTETPAGDAVEAVEAVEAEVSAEEVVDLRDVCKNATLARTADGVVHRLDKPYSPKAVKELRSILDGLGLELVEVINETYAQTN